MKPLDPQTLAQAEAHPAAPSMAAILVAVEAVSDLSQTRRRDLRSAVKAVAKVLDLPLAQIPADLSWLRVRLAKMHPAQLGISAKRWVNIRSDLQAVFDVLGLRSYQRRRIKPNAAWQALLDRIHDKNIEYGVSRLARFCSRMNIAPDDVNAEVLEQLRVSLAEGSLLKDPDHTIRVIRSSWNRAVKKIPGWPQNTIAPPARPDRFNLIFEDFPPSFRDDVDAFMAKMDGSDPFAEDSAPKPLAPATLKYRRQQIRRMASALVLSGVPVDEVTGLDVLVTPDNVKRALRFLHDRREGPLSEDLHNLGVAMKVIAKHHVKGDAKTLENLKDICRRVRPDVVGMTDKTRERLRQFDDDRNVALLLHLPERLVAEAKKIRGRPRDAAVLMQMALAVELLLFTELRLKNLASLDLNQHFRWHRASRAAVCHLVIERTEVKNRQPLEFELMPDTVKLLKLYRDEYLPVLARGRSTYLFPGRSGEKPKSPENLSQQIKKTIRKYTGLTVHPHLFRHIGAKLYLDQNPGGYEVVRRVLGHASMDTTIRIYTGLETKSAAKHFDEEILKVRDRADAKRKARLKRKPRP
mgnify:CR=1 FL=1